MVPEQNLVARHWNTPCIVTRTGQRGHTLQYYVRGCGLLLQTE